MKIDSILLDLDGTLWDSVAKVSLAWQSVLDKYPGLRPAITDAEIANCMGFSLVEIGERIFPRVEPTLRQKILRECLAAEYAYLRRYGGQLYPGVRETLAELAQDYTFAIVSNCEEGYIECFLQKHQLAPYIADFESLGRTGRAKGENILLVMARLGSKRAIYVGDMIKDSIAAEYAAIPYVYAAYGFGQGSLKPECWDYRIDSFPELRAVIETINRQA